MKKIIILTLAFIFAASISFAATTTAKTKVMTDKLMPVTVFANSAKMKTEMKEMTGKVKTVTVANPSKGTKSEIIVTDDKAAEKTFFVNPTTTIYDVKFKAIGLDKIKANDKVKVKYTITKEGVYEAASINILT